MAPRSRKTERDDETSFRSALRRASSLKICGNRKQIGSEVLTASDAPLTLVRSREPSSNGRNFKPVKNGRQSTIMKKVDRKRKNVWRSPTPGPSGIPDRSYLRNRDVGDSSNVSEVNCVSKDNNKSEKHGNKNTERNDEKEGFAKTNVPKRSDTPRLLSSSINCDSKQMHEPELDCVRVIMDSNCTPCPKPSPCSTRAANKSSPVIDSIISLVPRNRKPITLSYVNINIESSSSNVSALGSEKVVLVEKEDFVNDHKLPNGEDTRFSESAPANADAPVVDFNSSHVLLVSSSSHRSEECEFICEKEQGKLDESIQQTKDLIKSNLQSDKGDLDGCKALDIGAMGNKSEEFGGECSGELDQERHLSNRQRTVEEVADRLIKLLKQQPCSYHKGIVSRFLDMYHDQVHK